MLMAHENAFLQFLHESGRRGDDDAGSINWFMGMAQRNAGRGHLGLRGDVQPRAVDDSRMRLSRSARVGRAMPR